MARASESSLRVDLEPAAETARVLLDNVERVVVGKREEIALVLSALASGGHVLLEDVPGTAKTVLARAISQSIEGAAKADMGRLKDLLGKLPLSGSSGAR